MGSRGRKSQAELTIVKPGEVTREERPGPPADLCTEQKREWVAIVNAYPAEMFDRGKWSMLAGYCRHTVAQRRLGELIDQLCGSEDFEIQEYDRLLKMQDREDRCIASLAVRLGFAYSTAYEKRPEKGKGTTKPPWEG